MSAFDLSSNLRPEIVVCGPAWVEYRLELDGAPQADRFSQILCEERMLGGIGTFTAVLLATWGAQVVLVAPDLGDDANGRFAHRELAATPNLNTSPLENRTDETPYRVLLVPPSGARCELWRGQLTQVAAENDIFDTSPAAWVLDDQTVRPQDFGKSARPYFASVASAQSTLGQGAALVWMRNADLSDAELQCAAADFGTTVIILERLLLRFSVCGAFVQRVPINKLAHDDKNEDSKIEGARAESVWTALIWGHLKGWEFENSLLFAQVVGEVTLENRKVVPSLQAISEAARGMLK